MDHFKNGDLKPVLDSTFSINELPAAHEKMEANQNMGKIVLIVKEEDCGEEGKCGLWLTIIRFRTFIYLGWNMQKNNWLFSSIIILFFLYFVFKYIEIKMQTKTNFTHEVITSQVKLVLVWSLHFLNFLTVLGYFSNVILQIC